MKLTADTNVLLRAMVPDDPRQMQAAQLALASAELIAIAVPSLCEMAWVLRQRYKHSPAQIAAAIRGLMASANVVADRDRVDAGLAMLDAGGDFADGAMAFEGRALGGAEFVSFDKKAVRLLTAAGQAARVLS